MVCIPLVTVQAIWENGKTINSMARAKRHGRIKVTIRGATRMDPRMEKAYTSMRMGLYTTVNGYRIRSKALEHTPGPIRKFTKDNGLIITCTDKASLAGQMAENMKENTLMIKSMGLAFILGLMAGNMLDSGKMDSNTAKASIRTLMVLREQVFGKKENV